MSEFQIKIDLNVLNHLGMGLYSNTPAVLTEIISNAWDADAENVDITLNTTNNTVTIADDGHGMTRYDIQNKFLHVGYARRSDDRQTSDTKNRQVMGRKGIGKLAMFSLAKIIEITTKKENEDAVAFSIDVEKLQSAIQSGQSYPVSEISPPTGFTQGTTIHLKELKKSIARTENYLKKRLARRFSVIGTSSNFKVSINNKTITPSDRDYFSDIQLLWEFNEDQTRQTECTNLKHKTTLPNQITYNNKIYTVSGYIAGVTRPSDLQKDSEISNNTITIIANGRVFQEDILAEFGNAKVFSSYLVGEVILDFLDDNDLPDMATSSRQQLQQDDPRYPVLKAFFTTALATIDKGWDAWRREIGIKKIQKDSPILINWLNKLQPSEKRLATKILGSINTISFSGSDETKEESRKTVLKNTLLAFEKLKIQGNLDALEAIQDPTSDNFKQIFASINDVEASMFHDITKQRLDVIEKLKQLVNNNELERTVQDFLYEHLWLLDASWERTTETYIEQTLTQEIKQVEPESKGARIDIAFKTIAGKHIIIEMKRPNINTSLEDLFSQGRKYIKATKQWYKNNPNSPLLNIEVIFLVGNPPSDFLPGTPDTDGMLLSISGRILTYKDLMTQSQQAYQEYYDASTQKNNINTIIESI